MTLLEFSFSAPEAPAPGLEVHHPLARRPAGLMREAKVAVQRLKYQLRPDMSPLKVFSPHRAMFVRLPKNASTSLMDFLYPDVPASFLPHFGADYYRRVFPNHFTQYLVFASLRNPLERFASAFSYYKNFSTVPEERKMMDEDLSFIKTMEDFLYWLNDHERLENAEVMNWLHFRRQRDYICDTSGNMIVDMMFPIEDMQPGLKVLGRFTGVERRITRRHASAKTKVGRLPLDRVRDHYGEDTALWNLVHTSKIGFTSRQALRAWEWI
ncbi:MAG: sulfotransferase family 2 domain-containing protein [Henriciella sp.]|uniref:sulfotransferase family 2 domain-containing protein n=1 Tax=Henriciella sp. TaxID=1968823 RepID=UPI003C709811